MKELMIAVERVVRPIRASAARKMKMRQELLTHLTSAFEEAKTRLGDEASALEEAVRRFGNPADLTRELQGSVPFYERVFFVPIPGTKWLTALESYLARSLKRSKVGPRLVASWWFLILFVLLAFPAISIWRDAASAVMAAEWLAVTAGTTCVLVFCGFATYRELSLPLRYTGVLRATVFAALAVAAPVVANTAMLHEMLDIPIHYVPATVGTVIGVLSVLGLAFTVRFQGAVMRSREEWTKLEIGD